MIIMLIIVTICFETMPYNILIMISFIIINIMIIIIIIIQQNSDYLNYNLINFKYSLKEMAHILFYILVTKNLTLFAGRGNF